MKKTLSYRQLPLAVAVLLALQIACAGFTPKRIAFNTIDDATTAAQAGMSAFNEVYQAGLVVPRLGRCLSNADRDVALAAYAKFQKIAYRAALILKGTLSAPGEDPIALASAAAVEVIAALKGLR